jgi:DNA-directed RNA polymerase subunit alpha
MGGAITGVKIDGVSHEYHIIDGVKESVIDIVLAMKQLRFSVVDDGEKMYTFTTTISGVGDHTAASLDLPA